MPQLGTTFSALQEANGGGYGAATPGVNPSGAGGLPLRLLRLKLMAEREAQNQKLAADQQMQQAALSHAAMMQSGQLGFSQSALNQKLAAEQAANTMHHGEFQTTEGRLNSSEQMAQEFRLKNLMQRAAEMKAQQDLQSRRLDLEAPGMQAHTGLIGAQTASVLGQNSRAQSNFDNDPDRMLNTALSPILQRYLATQGLGNNATQGDAPASVTNPFQNGGGTGPGEGDEYQQMNAAPLGGAKNPFQETSPLDDAVIAPPNDPNEMMIGPRRDGVPSGLYQSPVPTDGAPSGVMQAPDPNAASGGGLMDDLMRKRFGLPTTEQASHQRIMQKQQEDIGQLQYDQMKTQASGGLLPAQERQTRASLAAQFPSIYQTMFQNEGDPNTAKALAMQQLQAMGTAAGLQPKQPGQPIFGDSDTPVVPVAHTPPAIVRQFGFGDPNVWMNQQGQGLAGEETAAQKALGPAQSVLGNNWFGKAVGWGIGANPLVAGPAALYHVLGGALTSAEAPLSTGSGVDADAQRRRYLKGATNSAGAFNSLAPTEFQQPAMSHKLKMYLMNNNPGLQADQADALINAWH